jgi:molybdate transport system substrate-binding protein
MRYLGIRAAAFIAAAFLLGSTVPMFATPASGAGEEVSALVASNAQGAFTELIKQFEAKHKGVTVNAQYLGGADIGKLIDGQKPADVVLVGSTILDNETSYIAPPTAVLRNKEMILVPKGNPGKVHSLKDLANPGVKLAMGTPTSAVGRLASQVVQNAAADYGVDFVTNLRKNVVVEKDKGSEVVAAVGNPANAAITFASDVNPAKYDAIEIDDKYNVVSTYSMTVPKNAKNGSLGQDFVTLVAGPEGQATLKKFHYMAPK